MYEGTKGLLGRYSLPRFTESAEHINEKVYTYRGDIYPDFILRGNHAQYILPVASKICTGKGVDVGCGKDEWKFPGAVGIDLVYPAPYNDAYKIPFHDEELDYVFSSHCLEHLDDYYSALEEWTRILKKGGALFIYLPDAKACEYWRQCNNRKHRHAFTTDQLVYDLRELKYEYIFTTGTDAAYSFSVYAYK